MSAIDRVLSAIDSGLQSSSETGYATDRAELCARCQQVAPVEDGDLCGACRADLRGEGALRMDLKRHALRHRLDGFPIYGRPEDDEDDVIVGYIAESEWAWADLSEADQATIRATATEWQADPRGAGMTWDQVFPLALAEFGIACPHEWTSRSPYFRECTWCRVMERTAPTATYRCVGGPRDGMTVPHGYAPQDVLVPLARPPLGIGSYASEASVYPTLSTGRYEFDRRGRCYVWRG